MDANCIGNDLFTRFPHHRLTISCLEGTLISLYNDDQLTMDNTIQYKSIADLIPSTDKAINAVTGNVGGMIGGDKGRAVGESIGSGISWGVGDNSSSEPLSPWTSLKKFTRSTHGNISLQFLVLENKKTTIQLLNKMSLAKVNKDLGIYEYNILDYGDAGKSLLSKDTVANPLDAIKGAYEKLKSNLFKVQIGSWFRAQDLVLDSLNYAVSTRSYTDKGSPNYITVTMNLSPVRDLGEDEISDWFILGD